MTDDNRHDGKLFLLKNIWYLSKSRTVKPVYNDHLYNKMYHLWFIQLSVLMKTECTNLLLLTISAFWCQRDIF